MVQYYKTIGRVVMNIIPMPKSATLKDAKIRLGKNTVIEGDFSKTSELLKEYLNKFECGENTKINFVKNTNIAEEGYEIKSEKDGIVISASTDKGAFYAIVTLKQAIDDGDGAFGADIKDAPKYEYRGFMLDCSRHFWRKEKIKQLLDVMADVKMNIFHWHLTDDQGWRAEIKKYPLLTQKGTTRRSSALYHPSDDLSKKITKDEKYGEGFFYSQEDMKDIVAYAASKHIEVVPEIDMPGHMVAAISCYPELSCRGKETEVSCRYGVTEDILCCGKERVFEFAKDIIDELCEIFPGRYFHIGGDEAPKARWKECPDCQQKIKELGLKDENALQGYFNSQMAKYLKSKGKRMIGWNEILDARDMMDKDIVAQWWWKYSIGNKNEKEWMREGGQCLLSLCPYVYMDHAFSMRPLKKTYSFSSKNLTDDDSQVLGMEIPQWCEFIEDEDKLDMLTYARLITFSEVCWTQDSKKDYKDFETRLENMRKRLGGLGAKICPQKIYRGKVKPFYVISSASAWAFWNKHHDFEFDQMKKMLSSD